MVNALFRAGFGVAQCTLRILREIAQVVRAVSDTKILEFREERVPVPVRVTEPAPTRRGVGLYNGSGYPRGG